MSSEGRRQLYTISSWRPFADDLAVGLLARFPDPLLLARCLLLLPSRRAVRTLTDAFVRHSEGRALLLPRMSPAGDLDIQSVEEWTAVSFADRLDGAAEGQTPVAPLARRLSLSRLIAATMKRDAPSALAMASLLGNALDTLEIEGRSAADLEDAVPEGELRQHHSANLQVLSLLRREWPELLKERGQMDAARRRNEQLRALSQQWLVEPPAYPVIMAGFSSAVPAVAELARVVTGLAQGALVLPGLDLSLGGATWAAIMGDDEQPSLETHPQYGMGHMLAGAGLSPMEALEWPHRSELMGSSSERGALVSQALRPPSEAALPAAPDPQAIQGVRMLEAHGPAEEALVIALALKQVTHVDGLTAALVTPDRGLARRVAVQLRRFGIEIDDSAGRPLASTLPGSLLVALATAAADRFSPVPLLSLLQHPLVRAGEGRLEWLNHVRALDKRALRGLRPPSGLIGVSRRLDRDRKAQETAEWWREAVVPALAPLDVSVGNAQELLGKLQAVAEVLAGPDLWKGDSGRALAKLLEQLDDGRDELSRILVKPEESAAFLRALMEGETVRPRFGLHPQLAILGPLEARLQSPDLLVIGGMNEGVWPGSTQPDPFLPPVVRRLLSLPGPARRTGYQAHDFASAMGAHEVLLTRSARADGTPQVASRFWQRLAASVGNLPDSGNISPPREALLQAARGLRHAAQLPTIRRPSPAPPLNARPKEISVTDVAMLKADPFAFYAKRVLRLKPLDSHDEEPNAAKRGEAVHWILEQWAKGGKQELDTLVDEALMKLGDRPDIEALWRPRVIRMIEWVIEQQAKEPEWVPIALEPRGGVEWNGIRIIGRADRVDSKGDALRVIDFKTGSPPAVKDVRGLYATQLALLAHIAEDGGMENVPRLPVERLDYFKLSGGEKPGELKPALGTRAKPEELPDHLDKAWADLEKLLSGYLLGDRPFEAKTHMIYGQRYSDFDHLGRLAEWLSR